MDCAADEYELHGECHKCRRCPPGQELKEDCGYGRGVYLQCGVCESRWFKQDWGSHPCRMCQTCSRINRHTVTHCTHTRNAVCGDCLPGFFSKTRLDGLQDAECLPCGPVHYKSQQCRGRQFDDALRVPSSEPPPQNSAATMTTATACVAAVTMVTILFVIVVLTCRGFSSLRSMLKGSFSPSGHHDTATASVSVVTEHRMTQEDDVRISDSSPSLTSDLGGCRVCASAPPLFTSVCREAGVVSQATVSLPPFHPPPLLRPPLLEEHHTPVECTELDFLHLSLHPENRGEENEGGRGGRDGSEKQEGKRRTREEDVEEGGKEE